MLDGASLDGYETLCMRNSLEGNGLQQCRSPNTGASSCDSGWTLCANLDYAGDSGDCIDKKGSKKCQKKMLKGKCSKKKFAKKKCALTCGECSR